MISDTVSAILDRHEHEQSKLIAILQDIQKEIGYLPEDALRLVANRLNVPLTRIYAIATFYQGLSLKPRGRHIVNVCLGTACHVWGGAKVMGALEKHMGIKAGETTPDERFTLETVRCVGCCALAPLVIVDDEKFHGKLTPDDAVRAMDEYD